MADFFELKIPDISQNQNQIKNNQKKLSLNTLHYDPVIQQEMDQNLEEKRAQTSKSGQTRIQQKQNLQNNNSQNMIQHSNFYELQMPDIYGKNKSISNISPIKKSNVNRLASSNSNSQIIKRIGRPDSNQSGISSIYQGKSRKSQNTQNILFGQQQLQIQFPSEFIGQGENINLNDIYGKNQTITPNLANDKWQQGDTVEQYFQSIDYNNNNDKKQQRGQRMPIKPQTSQSNIEQQQQLIYSQQLQEQSQQIQKRQQQQQEQFVIEKRQVKTQQGQRQNQSNQDQDLKKLLLLHQQQNLQKPYSGGQSIYKQPIQYSQNKPMTPSEQRFFEFSVKNQKSVLDKFYSQPKQNKDFQKTVKEWSSKNLEFQEKYRKKKLLPENYQQPQEVYYEDGIYSDNEDEVGCYETFKPDQKNIKPNEPTKQVNLPYKEKPVTESFNIYRVDKSVRQHMAKNNKFTKKSQYKKLQNASLEMSMTQQEMLSSQDQTKLTRNFNFQDQTTLNSRQNLFSRDALISREKNAVSRENNRSKALQSRERKSQSRENVLSRENQQSRGNQQSREGNRKILKENNIKQRQKSQEDQKSQEKRGNSKRQTQTLNSDIEIINTDKIEINTYNIQEESVLTPQNQDSPKIKFFIQEEQLDQIQLTKNSQSSIKQLKSQPSQSEKNKNNQIQQVGVLKKRGQSTKKKIQKQNTFQKNYQQFKEEEERKKMQQNPLPREFLNHVKSQQMDLEFLEQYDAQRCKDMRSALEKLQNSIKEYGELNYNIIKSEKEQQEKFEKERKEYLERTDPNKIVRINLTQRQESQYNTPDQTPFSRSPLHKKSLSQASVSTPQHFFKSKSHRFEQDKIMEKEENQKKREQIVQLKQKKSQNNHLRSQTSMQSNLTSKRSNYSSQQQEIIEKTQWEVSQQHLKEIERLNFASNDLTTREKDYIKNQNELYNVGLVRRIKELVQQYGSLDNMPYRLKRRYFTEVDFIQTSDLQQLPVNERCREFFDTDQNIHDQLVRLSQITAHQFEHYRKKDQKEQKLQEQLKNLQLTKILQVDKNLVSQHEMLILQENFKKKASQRDFDFIEMISHKLKYLQQFSKATRFQLLKFANLVTYKQGKYIFYEGDSGDHMYIIVRGSVHVRIKTKNIEGEIENPVVITLYDGNAFGELALMKQTQPKGLRAKVIKQVEENKGINLIKIKKELEEEIFNQEHQAKNPFMRQEENDEEHLDQQIDKINEAKSVRKASIECAETSTFLTLNKQYFTAILINMIQQEQIHKLKLLQTLPFFDFYDAMSLIPLTTYLEEVNFNFGEVVIKEGDEADYFYIVSRGRFKIIKQEQIVRKLSSIQQENKKFGKYKLNCGYIDYVKYAVKEDLKRKTDYIGKEVKEVYEEKIMDMPLEFSNDLKHPFLEILDKQFPDTIICQSTKQDDYDYLSSTQRQRIGGSQQEESYDKVVLINTLVEKKFKYKIVFHINKMSDDGEIGLGVCYRNKMETNNYIFRDKSLGNGVFLIQSNGTMYSDIDQSINEQNVMEKFHFLQGQTIQVDLDPLNKSIIYTNLDNGLQHSFQIVYKNYDYFAFCVTLRENQDTVQVISFESRTYEEPKQTIVKQEEKVKENILQYQKLPQPTKELFKFNYYHTFGSLCRGECFMNRSIIQEYLKVEPSYLKEVKYNVMDPAKLTVIADSSKSQVFRIAKQSIIMLESSIRSQLVKGVAQLRDYDYMYDQQQDTWTKQWDQFKVNVLSKVLTERDLHKVFNTQNHPKNEAK